MTNRGRGIALIGYRGTGKSTVGRVLAERLGRPFADADREVESQVGRSIRSIFLEDGEPPFREAEAQVLASLAERLEGGVLATGGGAILLESNRRVLRRFGFVAWLTADADTLAHRLQASRRGVNDRPPLTVAGTLLEIAEVLEARTPLYRETADAEVSTIGLDAEQVAEAVLEAWSRHLSEQAGNHFPNRPG
jgi:shikimate kinase